MVVIWVRTKEAYILAIFRYRTKTYRIFLPLLQTSLVCVVLTAILSHKQSIRISDRLRRSCFDNKPHRSSGVWASSIYSAYTHESVHIYTLAIEPVIVPFLTDLYATTAESIDVEQFPVRFRTPPKRCAPCERPRSVNEYCSVSRQSRARVSEAP